MKPKFKPLCLFIVGWIICGILTYGMSFAYWQGKYPLLAARDQTGDRNTSIQLGLFGPIGLIRVFFLSDFVKYGLKFRFSPPEYLIVNEVDGAVIFIPTDYEADIDWEVEEYYVNGESYTSKMFLEELCWVKALDKLNEIRNDDSIFGARMEMNKVHAWVEYVKQDDNVISVIQYDPAWDETTIKFQYKTDETYPMDEIAEELGWR